VPDREWAMRKDAEAVRRGIAQAIDRVNGRLSSTERVRRFLLADDPFTIDNGALTPSLKIRRHVLRARYGERMDALYAR
jgi:long-chain acyl-CoA synthetase